MPKHGNIRRHRKGHRAKRAYHLSKGVNALQEKHYTVNFTPNDTYINNILSNPPGTTGNYYTISRGAGTSYNGADLFVPQFATTDPGMSAVRPSAVGFNTVVDFGIGISYNINMLENWAAYCALFDNYRVNYIDLEVEFLANNAVVSNSGLLPVIYAINDRDDSVAPTDQHFLTGRQGFKTLRVGNRSKTVMKLRLRPKLAMPLAIAAVPDSHSPPLSANTAQVTANTWIDCQPSPLISDSPPLYFGTKLWLQNMPVPRTDLTFQNAVRFTTKWNVSFKGSLGAF